jgi:hypothetical protein
VRKRIIIIDKQYLCQISSPWKLLQNQAKDI